MESQENNVFHQCSEMCNNLHPTVLVKISFTTYNSAISEGHVAFLFQITFWENAWLLKSLFLLININVLLKIPLLIKVTIICHVKNHLIIFFTRFLSFLQQNEN